MSELISPESRVFHIGHECYVVYLGTQIDDIKPFLRIGNAKDIPDEVLEALSTTVVTDDHLGNPLLEILLAPRFHGRYLGDTGVIDTIRSFFKSFDLPTEDIVDYHKVEDGERRHMIWFYTGGNIHLRYDDRVIFDLHKREKEDRHFVRFYEEARHNFLRNPLRYVRQDFAGHGIYLAKENCFWYEKGDFISFTPHPGLAAELMSNGVDPDYTAAVAYDLKDDGLDSHDSAVFIGILKRMRARRKQLKVITTYPALQRKLKFLFPERKDLPSTLEIANISGKRRTTFHDSIISSKEDQIQLRRSDLPDIAFNLEIENGLSIDIEKGLIKYNSKDLSKSFPILKGFPIELKGQSAIPSQLTGKYISLMLLNMKKILSDDKYQILSALESYLKNLAKEISVGNNFLSSQLKQDSDKSRNDLRNFPNKDDGSAWFFLSNCCCILNLIHEQLGKEHGLSKNIMQVANAIRKLTSRLSTPNPLLPFWGDLYLGEKTALLWFATKRGFNAAEIEAARDSAERIGELADLDESSWQENLDRLLALIRSLKRGEGPLTEKQLVHLDQTKAARGKKNLEMDEAKSDSARKHEELGATSVLSMTRETRRREKISRPKWPWITLACALLLFGGVILLDYMGRAPWNSIIRGTEEGATAKIVDTDVQSDYTEVQRELGVSMNDSASSSPSEVDEVDIDVAPKTVEEVESYLNVENRVVITEIDIHLAANEIAILNGFRDLDYRVFTGADPDWILPGNTLDLPDGGLHAIRSGDTIWFLAAREVRSDSEKRMEIFDEAVSILEESNSDFESRTSALATLRDISENSEAAQMREMARDVLLSLRR